MVGGGHILRTNHNDEAIIAITEQIRKIREENARRHSRDYSHVFRPKSRWDLTRLACILVGIEFAYAAETAFVSPILLEIGIEHKLMTMVWSLSPMLGFLVGPLLGSISDRCRLRLGRRRPIIMGLCILILFGLVLVPWGKTFSIMLDKEYPIVQEFNVTESLQNLTTPRSMSLKLEPRVLRWATVFTVLGTVMLDFAADTVQTPARTYLLDVCLPSDQAKGLSTCTIVAGFGGFFGYSLGGINWSQTNIGLFLGGNIKTVFTIVTVVFIITALITLTSFREVPLDTMEKDDLLKPITDICIQSALVKDKNKNAIYNIRDASNNVVSINNELKNEMPSNTVAMENGTIEKDLDKGEHLTLMKYMRGMVVMPKSLKILCLTNLLSWMGHVCYCLYFADFVGEAVFNGNPSGDLSEAGKQSFDAGVRFGCWGMAIYALSCSFYSMIIEILIKYLGARLVYIAGLLAFGFSMILLAAIPTKITVLLLSIPAGIIYSTVFTIPYLIVANYHAKNSFKSKNGENIPLKRPRGLGTDVAVISSMMFVAQICVSLTVGSMISATGHINVVIYAAGTFSILAAIAATKIQYLDL